MLKSTLFGTLFAATMLLSSVSHAALIPVQVDVTSTWNSVGGGSGTYNTVTQDLNVNYTLHTPNANMDTVNQAHYNGLMGEIMTLSCEGPPSQCSWVPENQWQSVIVLSNSLDALGNGVIETQFSVGITTVDSTFSVSAVPVPASAILFGSALLGLIGVRSKQRQ